MSVSIPMECNTNDEDIKSSPSYFAHPEETLHFETYVDGANVHFDHDYCGPYAVQLAKVQKEPQRIKHTPCREQIGHTKTSVTFVKETESVCTEGTQCLASANKKEEFIQRLPKPSPGPSKNKNFDENFGSESRRSVCTSNVDNQTKKLNMSHSEVMKEAYIVPSEEEKEKDEPRQLSNVRVKFLKDISFTKPVTWRSRASVNTKVEPPNPAQGRKCILIMRKPTKPRDQVLRQSTTEITCSKPKKSCEIPIIDLTEEIIPNNFVAETVLPQENIQHHPGIQESLSRRQMDEAESLCRLCGKESTQLTTLFGLGADEGGLVPKINFHLPIQVDENDVLPLSVCLDCTMIVNSFDVFYNQCLKVDSQMKKSLSKSASLQTSSEILAPVSTNVIRAPVTPNCVSHLDGPSSVTLEGQNIDFSNALKVIYTFQENNLNSQDNILVERSQVRKMSNSKEPQTTVSNADISYFPLIPQQFELNNSEVLEMAVSNKENTSSVLIECEQSLDVLSESSTKLSKGMAAIKPNLSVPPGHTHKQKRLKVKKQNPVHNKEEKCNADVIRAKSITADWRKNISNNVTKLNPSKVTISNTSNGEQHGFDDGFEPSNAIDDFASTKSSLTGEKGFVSSTHKCEICNQVFGKVLALSKHRKSHRVEERLKCPDCGKVMPNDRSLKTHLKTHTDDGHACDKCGKILANKSSLAHHLKAIHGDASFCCQICGKTVKTLMYLRKHLVMHSTEKPFSCSECGQYFKTKMTLKQHTLIHADIPHYICDICGHVTRRRSHLALHMLRHKPGGNNTQIYTIKRQGRCSCSVCHLKFIAHNSMLAHRASTHSEEEIFQSTKGIVSDYQCCYCDKVCNSQQSLQSHERACDRKYTCKFCGKVVSSARALQYHLREHTGERPFTCRYCGKGFKGSEPLTRHENVHRGERPHKCNVCGKSFYASITLCQHKRIHQEKKYKCTLCSYEACRPAAIRIHMRVHTNDRPYACLKCDKAYKQITDLKKHVAAHHKTSDVSD